MNMRSDKEIKCGEIYRTASGKNCFLCIICGKGFEFSNHIVDHMRSHLLLKQPSAKDVQLSLVDNIERYAINTENKSNISSQFTSQGLLSNLKCKDDPNQMLMLSKPKDKPTSKYFTCIICYRNITHKYKMKHMASHYNLKQFKCKLCEQAYNSAGALTKHARVHAKDYALPTCDYCRRTFKTKYILKVHIVKHTNQSAFKCDPCQRVFSMRSLYDAHVRRHQNEKPFQCVICGLAFVSVNCLNSHTRRHNPKRHKCDLCDRAFFKPFQLAEHKMSTHSGERTFICDICGKSFGTRKVLGQHKRLHDLVKRYKCQFCSTAFAQSSGRRKHEKLKHGYIK